MATRRWLVIHALRIPSPSPARARPPSRDRRSSVARIDASVSRNVDPVTLPRRWFPTILRAQGRAAQARAGFTPVDEAGADGHAEATRDRRGARRVDVPGVQAWLLQVLAELGQRVERDQAVLIGE